MIQANTEHTEFEDFPKVGDPNEPLNNFKYNKYFSDDFISYMKKHHVGIHKNALEYMEGRRITKTTCEVYGLNGSKDAIYFNYLSVPCEETNHGCKICKIKARKLGNIPNGQDKYLKIKGKHTTLFGAHLYKGQPHLLVCEGEIDAMSGHEGIFYAGLQNELLSVSIPNGTSYGFIDSCEEFLRQFDTIIICSDLAPSGIQFKETCIKIMLSRGYKVRFIDLKDTLTNNDHQDLNDVLVFHGQQAIADLFKNIQAPSHSCGLIASEIETEKRDKPFFTGYWGVDRSCKFAGNEVCLLAGNTNEGKSTILKQMINYNISLGNSVGVYSGEETNQMYRNLSIRQVYDEPDMFTSEPDYFGDHEPEPTKAAIEKWNKEYGRSINLFQSNIPRNANLGARILDWISHCADVEGRTAFYLDNLSKIVIDDPQEELIAQAKFLEKIYNIAKDKNVFIMIVVHVKKYVGLIHGNAISGSKKLQNIPDYLLLFQNVERLEIPKDDIPKTLQELRENAGIFCDVKYSSYITSSKIRNKPFCYDKRIHIFRYDPKTTRSTELLPERLHTRTHKNGYSIILTPAGTEIDESQESKP